MIGLYTDGNPKLNGPVFDYSRAALPTLDEHAMPESSGIQDPTGHITFFDRKPQETDCLTDPKYFLRFPYPAIDWNCSGQVDDDPPAISDVNGDGTLSNALSGFDDWAHIDFSGGGVIGTLGAKTAARLADVPTEPEPTLQDFLRIVPASLWQGRGTHPIALFAVTPISGTLPLNVSFDGSAAYDPDNGTITAYQWNSSDGGTGSGKTIQHSYKKAGTYQAVLNVTDNNGKKNLVTLPVTITVTNPTGTCDGKPYKPTLNTPQNGSTNQPNHVKLKWKATNCAASYTVTIRQGSKHGKQVASQSVTHLSYKTQALQSGTTYVWRVAACDTHGCANSKWWSFTIKP